MANQRGPTTIWQSKRTLADHDKSYLEFNTYSKKKKNGVGKEKRLFLKWYCD